MYIDTFISSMNENVIIKRLLFLTRKNLPKRPERRVSSQRNQEGYPEFLDKFLSILIPSTAKHWAVILFFYDHINNHFFKKVVEVFEDDGKIKASVKEWSKKWQNDWQKQVDIGENEFLPSFTMIDKNLVGEDSLTSTRTSSLNAILTSRIRCDADRLEWFVGLFNDENYPYNTFDRNSQLFVNNLLLFLNLKPIQRLLPWTLDYIIAVMMLVATTPFSYNYIIQHTSYIENFSLFVFNGFDPLLMIWLVAVSWMFVFLLRDTFGGVCKIKYLAMGWIHIMCYSASYLGLIPALLFFNTQWAALLMTFMWYRFFRLIFYGNMLHYPKCYSWFSDVSQNVNINR